MSDRYPCPCCGHRVLDAMPGSYEICPVCFWEGDGVQFRWPTMAGGANKVSLIEAQRNYQNFGACDQHGLRYVRPPAEDEPLDPAWRPIDLTRDSSPAPPWTGNSTGPRPGSTWSRSPAPGPCWKPQKPPPAATSSSPPPGSTVPTCTRRGDRCRSSTPRRSATAT
nr:CPCC family cysteine-rich protein [Streptomyces sp. Ncost-T10-10d]